METAKNGMPRFALSEPSIGSTTTRVEPLPRRPTSSETIATSRSRKRARIASSAALSTAVVSSPPRPSPTTGSRSTRVGSSTSTPRTSATAPRQRSSQSVKRQEQQAGRQLRIEERALLRHHVAAPRDLPDVLDPRRAEQEGGLGLAAVDGGDRLPRVRRVRHAGRLQAVDDDRVELVVLEQLVAALAVEDESRKVVTRRIDRSPLHPVEGLDHPVRREDRQPLLVGRDDHDEQPRRRLAPVLGVEGERRLVAVVPVGDQELRVAELLGQRVAELRVEPPEARAHAALVRLQIRLAEPVEVDAPVPEQEDRLEQRPRRAQQPQPPLLGARVRALVREDDAALVRLGAQRGDE